MSDNTQLETAQEIGKIIRKFYLIIVLLKCEVIQLKRVSFHCYSRITIK